MTEKGRYQMFPPQNENAVSPVIGVILMVAITVILAAVISSFVFGMATNIRQTRQVAATVQQPDATSIVVTYQGGRDAGTCTQVRWDVTESGDTTVSQTTTMIPATGSILEIGKSLTLTGSFTGKDHVTATATFSDGSRQVILDAII